MSLDSDIYYSAERNGFFLSSDRELYEGSVDGWPKDAKKITRKYYLKLLSGQERGLGIVGGEDGYPCLSEPKEVVFTKEQLVDFYENEKQKLLSDAARKIAPLQDAYDLNLATESEIKLLNEWKLYRVTVNRIDVMTEQDIEWPVKPE